MKNGNFSKKEYKDKLVENMPLLRSKLNLNQEELANILGTTRQTISSIERGEREIMWDTCMGLTLLFMSNSETNSLMEPLGIDTTGISEYLKIGKK